VEASVETLRALEQMTSGVVGELADVREGLAAFRARRPAIWMPLSPEIEDE
jgi:hypothetical protein